MDFHQLLAKMQQLDQPVGETAVPECGEPMGMTPPMGMPPKADTPPPSMSVNLNAQGMDNIEQLLKLVTKVNPDMEKPAMPPMAAAPAIEIEPMDKPAGGLPSLGNLDSGPLKMLPDLDSEEPAGDIAPPAMMDKPDDGDDGVSRAQGDLDHDGDHDMDDHDMEKVEPEEEKEDEGYDKRDAYERDFDASQTGFGPREREDDEGEDESFANSVSGSEPDTMNVDAAVHDGNDLNKPKTMTKHSYRQGDNPMAMEGNDLRASIRAELLQRLAEAKGAK